MAVRTNQELIDEVKTNLGKIDSGEIGSRTVDEAIREFINFAFLKIVKKTSYEIGFLERDFTINVTSSAYKYTIPTTDVSGNTVKIKNYVKLVIKEVGATTGDPLERITPSRRFTIFPLTNSSHKARPWLYSIFAGNIELYPFPGQSYTIEASCDYMAYKSYLVLICLLHKVMERNGRIILLNMPHSEHFLHYNSMMKLVFGKKKPRIL